MFWLSTTLSINITMRVILFLLMLIPSTAWAWEDWDRETKTMFVASSIAITADWATTRDMTGRYDEGYYELNPILGSYPTRTEVDLYMIGMLVTNYFITDWLPKEHRIFYLGVRTITHGSAAHNNAQIGLRLRF